MEQQDVREYEPAIRGKPFKKFIRKLLTSRAGIDKAQVKHLTDRKGMELFTSAFTHKSAETKGDYEVLEFMGDGIINTCVIWYIPKRFPKIVHNNRALSTEARAGIYTLIKNNLISEKALSARAEHLGFWPYIEASDYEKSHKKIKLLEDIFEAFLAALVQRINLDHSQSSVGMGIGFGVCYQFVSSIVDEIDIPIDNLRSLKNATMQLKELYDTLKWVPKGKAPEYKQVEERTEENPFYVMGALGRVPKRGYRWEDVVGDDADPNSYTVQVIGRGKAPKKKKAIEAAAREALAFLDKNGIRREYEYEYEE